MEFIWTNIIIISVLALYLYSVVSTLTVLLLENRNPIRSIAWVLVIMFLPLLGVFFYLVLGQNLRQKKKIIKRRIRKFEPENNAAIHPDELLNKNLCTNTLNLIKLIQNEDDNVVYGNNNITVLSEPEKTFDSIFKDIEQAKSHIHIEFYIISNDRVGHKLKELLIKKAQEGVEVKLIYDYWGCFELNKAYFRSLKKAGVEFQAFYPPRFPYIFSRINFRSHRKIVIVDGKTGYTGGVNMADRYLYGDYLGAWRDTMVKLEGSAVYGLQETFHADWYFTCKEMLKDSKYFPKPEKFNNDNIIQIVDGGPDKQFKDIMLGFYQAITTASEYLYIHTPYFMPTDEILTAILTAALRGVDVRLMIPTKSDTSMAQASNNSFIERLHEAGVKVYWYTSGFLHSKTFVIDDKISTIGTANMDFRSFEQNFEVNAFIYDRETALKLKALFMEDLELSKEIIPSEWKKRPKYMRIKESFSRLFSPAM